MALGEGCLTGFIRALEQTDDCEEAPGDQPFCSPGAFYHQAEAEVGGDLDKSVLMERVSEGWGEFSPLSPVLSRK